LRLQLKLIELPSRLDHSVEVVVDKPVKLAKYL
jgi:hypothetical protein